MILGSAAAAMRASSSSRRPVRFLRPDFHFIFALRRWLRRSRAGSKTAQVVAMLKRKNGATLAEIMEKMGWQRHTVRGFMAGAMKKAGYTVESFKPEGGERTYRLNP